MKRRIIFAFCAVSFAGLTFGGQEDALLAFVKANTGKFSSEISGLPRSVTVRAKPFDGWWQFGEFDQQSGKLVADGSNVWSLWLFQRCAKAGSFVGGNVFGAKATVQKMKCERLEIEDVDIPGVKLGSLDCSFFERLTTHLTEEERSAECKTRDKRRIEIPMTAQQYRTIKAAGVIYEVNFDVGAETKQEVVLDAHVVAEATVSSPIEKSIRVLTVAGKMKAVRILTPDGKTVLVQYDR
ncbi:MAG: hypothetical protein M1392_06530 [Gammaproteobacteria bacterium]|nr:hypothetical protein [Gammaproteobacteria bacterium]